MSIPAATSAPPDGAALAAALEHPGYVVIDGALAPAEAHSLITHLFSLDEQKFVRAGVGRESAFRRNPRIRGDEICWLETGQPATDVWFARMEALRLELNRRLFLGLFDYECHYARYPVGSFYRKHVDAFRGEGNRVVSSILYLNADWRPGDGGELLLYTGDAERPPVVVEPLFNRLVLFLSTEFPHEVLPAKRPRYSLTGWFRLNGSRGELIDPPR